MATPSTGHVTPSSSLLLLLSFLFLSSSSSDVSRCPGGCTCRPDPAVRDVEKPIRLTCSGRAELPLSLEDFPSEDADGREEGDGKEKGRGGGGGGGGTFVDGNVTSLDLSERRLPVLKKSFKIFSAFPHVRHLNLSRCQMEVVERGALGQFRSLRTLDLSHNRLTLLDHGLFSEQDEESPTETVDGNEGGGGGRGGGGGGGREEEERTYNDGTEREEEEEDEDEDDEEDEEEEEEEGGDSRKRPTSRSLKRSLLELNLSSNELVAIDGSLDGLRALTRLNLEGNELAAVTRMTFRGLGNLRWLALGSNRLRSVHPDAFESTGRLTSLVLKGNPRLERLDRLNLGPCRHLNYLDLSECGLVEVPGGLPDSLRYLQLRRNRLSAIGADSFAGCCAGLNILLADGNEIASVADGALSGMRSLQQLWLNENRLAEVPRRLPKSLQRLLLDGNRLTDWPPKVFDDDDDDDGSSFSSPSSSSSPPPPALSILSLSGNRIAELRNDTFGELRSLSSLDLSDNRIAGLSAGSFARNAALESLNLNRNPLARIDDDSLAGLPSLRNLYLSFVDTPLNDLQASRAFLRPVGASLRSLELDHSPSLASLLVVSRERLQPKRTAAEERDSEDFSVSELESLEELSVTGADLTTLKRKELDGFLPPGLKTFRFASSRWHCDRSLAWLQEWLAGGSSGLQAAESNLCYSPRSLHGRPLVSLAAKEFAPVTAPPPLVAAKPTKLTKPTQPSSKAKSSSTSKKAGKRHQTTMTTTTKMKSTTEQGSKEREETEEDRPTTKSLDRDGDDDDDDDGDDDHYQHQTHRLPLPPLRDHDSHHSVDPTSEGQPTLTLNSEESLLIHVTDFIRKNRIGEEEEDEDATGKNVGEKNKEIAEAGLGGEKERRGGGGGGGGVGDENESESAAEIEITDEERQSETDISVPNDETVSFDKYFRQYFPANGVDDDHDVARHALPDVDGDGNRSRDGDFGGVARDRDADDDGARNDVILVIAVVIVVVTAIVAAFIVFLIALTCRTKERRRPAKGEEPAAAVGPDSSKTVIRYKSRDGVLYFSANSAAGSESLDAADEGSGRPPSADRKFNESGRFRSSPTSAETRDGYFQMSSNSISNSGSLIASKSGLNNSNNSNSNTSHVHYNHHQHGHNHNGNGNHGNGNHGNGNNFVSNKTLSYRWEET